MKRIALPLVAHALLFALVYNLLAALCSKLNIDTFGAGGLCAMLAVIWAEVAMIAWGIWRDARAARRAAADAEWSIFW